MTAATVETVPPAPSQMREVGEVLARALHDDPHWLWILPDESRRTQVLPWFMKACARYCQKHGVVHTTAGKVEGAALWIPPGKYPPSVVGMILAGMILVPVKFGRAALGRLMSGVNYAVRLHKRDAPRRHWYLSTLGVEPPRQGQGIGSALIQPVLARADAEGLVCYVETEKERNVRFYRRHGFEVVVESDVPNGGPHMWTMRREPQG
ncbi:MAG: GNAT family N-acetyltransferase [Dehalococcoidia bacterium]|nr:MAG: GNAT family N-acetyltransferase [Dehalococcoidia bacterium]